MSKTLTLIEAGWESVRSLASRGQRATALKQLARLLARPDLPAALAGEGHTLAGELALELEKYTVARRHLRVAAALNPEHAATRYALGRTWQEDPDGCDRRAALYFLKATKLDEANPLYRAAFGRAVARCGTVKRGMREMLAAADQGAGDLAVVCVAVGGLLEVGKANEARQVVAKARFLNPGNSELAGMWSRVKFETARMNQRKLAKTANVPANSRDAQDAHFATDGDRSTLPFIRLVEGTFPKAARAEGETVRRDVVSLPRPHFARMGARKADG